MVPGIRRQGGRSARSVPGAVREHGSADMATEDGCQGEQGGRTYLFAALAAAPQAASREAAGQLVGEASERMGVICVHGAFKVTSLVLGAAAATALLGTVWAGVPVGLLAGFGAGYLLDPIAHVLGKTAGHGLGSVAGSDAWKKAHP